ncbi:transcription factor bHLH94 [Elaeis guineensis]|uniref:Transcription factor bHLH94 n=1 Tax=Elaeis guineensis var. tenera TaxID=51953 RepID=A0A6I9R2A6_ELAGV|nr:transcription factor bHLH94 [Elaeis guineensis]
MALEAVVFPQGFFGYTCKEWCYNMGGEAWGYDFGRVGEEEEEKREVLECELGTGKVGGSWDPPASSLVQNLEEWDANSSLPEPCEGIALEGEAMGAAAAGRRKRRRAKSVKNKEEVESQRMIHIAVERNRRKQMNEYLAVLRSLMPSSYVQRGDQASIIGGAINYVKELEQLLQSLEVQKRLKQRSDATGLVHPFANFFAFPQYSSCSSGGSTTTHTSSNHNIANEMAVENRSAMADIEVTMVESYANLKVLSRRWPKQLLKMVMGLQNMRLTTLHLNVTTVDQLVLYSFSLKVEDDCQFTSVDDIATAVYQMLGRIQEEANFS